MNKLTRISKIYSRITGLYVHNARNANVSWTRSYVSSLATLAKPTEVENDMNARELILYYCYTLTIHLNEKVFTFCPHRGFNVCGRCARNSLRNVYRNVNKRFASLSRNWPKLRSPGIFFVKMMHRSSLKMSSNDDMHTSLRFVLSVLFFSVTFF